MDELSLKLIKQVILRETADLAFHLMVHGRETDKVLTRDRIEEAFATGTVTVEEVASLFKETLQKLI